MDDGLLSLKWNNHKTTFFEILKNLREKSNFTDATLAVEGKFYPVHKLVMSTCSEYFSDIFERTPCKSPVIVLKDVRSHDIEALLDYMYIGEVNVNQNDLASLLKTAECLRIKGLAVPDEDPTKVRKNSTSSHDDTHRESPPPKRRRHDSNPVPPRAVSPVPSPQKPVIPLVNPAQTPSLPTPSLPTHSTSNTLPRTEQEEPPVVKVEMDDEEEQEDRFRRENNYEGGASSDRDPSGDYGSDLSKTELEPESYGNASFPGPSLQQGVDSHWDEGDSSSFPPESYSGDVPSSQHAQGGRGSMHFSDQSTLKLLPPISAQNQLENFQIKLHPARDISSHVNQTGNNLRDDIGQFSSESIILNHENENTGLAFSMTTDYNKKRCVDSRHQCFLCGKIFQFSNDLRKHIRTHTGEKPYGCPYCSYRATQKVHLRGHILRKHLPVQNLD